MKQNHLVIFAGAGASFGILPEKYPTTVQFRERLPASITDQAAFTIAEAFLRDQKNQTPPHDIEKVLWALQELQNAVSPITAEGGFAEHLFRTGAINNIYSGFSTGHYLQYLNSITTILTSLINSINATVFNLYKHIPTVDQLSLNWIPLLQWATQKFEKVDIVTTNYDLVIEIALAHSGISSIETGRTTNVVLHTIDTAFWNESDIRNKNGLLTKLHGSIDWIYGDLSEIDVQRPIVTGVREFAGDGQPRALIYPGFKGQPINEPFVTFHNYFARAIMSCTHMISIGFAFRDEHINAVFKRTPVPSRRTLIVDPSPPSPENLPKLGAISFLERGFGLNTVTMAGKSDFMEEVEQWFRGNVSRYLRTPSA